MAPGNAGGGNDYSDAKHLLDSIGKEVHDKVKNGGADAKKYIEELKGQLSFATLLGVESASSPNPCNLESEYTKLINGSGSGSGVAARIFGHIYEELKKDRKNWAKELQKRYNGDEDKNFFQLREDWWYANRETVWKAITCDAPTDAQYFGAPCDRDDNEKHSTLTKGYCRCKGDQPGQDRPNTDPPTYFDYVPQYLRWFEEWAEDFCTKRKHKLKDAIKKCRGDSGKEKYCSGNGLDCTKTVRGDLHFVVGDCRDCLVACSPFVKWLDNQKQEFEKQKEKYADEIKKANGKTTKETSNGPINNLYVKEFYEKLEKQYKSVQTFLGLLNKETTCKEHPEVEVKGKKADHVDFKNHEDNETFCRTEYCKPCPWCGAEQESGGGWKAKTETCGKIMVHNPDNITKIPVLTPEKGKFGIYRKYKRFCESVKDTVNGGGGGSDGAGGGASGARGKGASGGVANRTAPGTAKDVAIDKKGGKSANGKNGNQIVTWQCYYDKDKRSGQNDNCVEVTRDKFTQGKKVKPYYAFFWDWVYHMLHDSLEWRKQLGRCINKKEETKCIGSCKKKCDCYKKWVEHMRTEWEQIEKHFDKQGDLQGSERNTTLKLIFQLFFMDKIKEAYGENKLNELKQKLERNGRQKVAGDTQDSEDAIKFLLKHELEEAEKCLKTHNEKKCEEQATRARGRADHHDDQEPQVEQSSDDEEEEEEENEDDVEEPEAEPPPKKEEPACEIVKKLFENEASKDYTDWCTQKYSGKNSYRSWDCRQSTFKKEHQGACMPPRRKYLYIHKLKNLNSDKTSTDIELRKAFIECAAIETFFSWHEFKKDKEREEKEQQSLLVYAPHVEEQLQKDLENGTIPEEFKRQMFYTFGDYRDLCLGNDIGKAADTTGISDKVKSILSGKTPNGEECETWWNTNAAAIWDGMICALSYDTNDKNVIEGLRDRLIKPDKKNDYDKVKISSVTSNNDPSGDTLLSDFVKRPTFFRWLEEWAEEFFRKRTYTLKRIEDECRGNNYSKYCDGDGFDCTEIGPNMNETITTFNCPTCGKYCRFYKHWINRKKDEFEKQEKKYQNKIDDAEGNSAVIYHKEFYTTLKAQYPTVKQFLKTLKDGPFSNNNIGDNEIDFNKPNLTFGPAENCAPCPIFGVERIKGVLSKITEKTCGKGTFKDTFDIKNMENPTGKGNILVIDNSTKVFEGDLEVCNGTDIVKGIRKDEWSCGYVFGYDVCELKTFKRDINDKQNIKIRTLFKIWIEIFLKDYNKIKEYLNRCMNNGRASICSNKCGKNCECIEKWAKEKMTEWKKVRELYFKQYRDDNIDEVYEVRRFLGDLKPQTEVKKAIEPFENLDNLQYSSVCTDSNRSEKGQTKYNDVVVCLLDKLKRDIKTCKKNPHTTTKSCTETLPEPPSSHDDSPYTEEPDDNHDQYTQQPKFCPKVDTPEKTKTVHDILCNNQRVEPCNSLKKYHSTIWDKGSTSTNRLCNKNNLVGIGAKWTKFSNDNGNIYVSPRTKQLCLTPIMKVNSTSNKQIYIQNLQKSAFLEAKGLYEYYKKNQKKFGSKNGVSTDDDIKNNTLQAMRRSYADYSDLIKGNSVYDYNTMKNQVAEDLKILQYKDNANGKTPENFWDEYKTDIWHSMLCGYNAANTNNPLHENDDICKLPTTDNDNQLLRWFVEWGEDFCFTSKNRLENMREMCSGNVCKDSKGYSAIKQKCNAACEKYTAYIKEKKTEYDEEKANLVHIKEKLNDAQSKDILEHFKAKCTEKCKCITEIFTNKDNWDNPMDNIDTENFELKKKCECSKHPGEYKDTCDGLSISGSGFPDGSAFGGGISNGKCNAFLGGEITEPAKPNTTNNCIENIANKLQKTEKQKLNHIVSFFNLKGVIKQDITKSSQHLPCDICKPNECLLSGNNKIFCNNNINVFDEKEWDCNKENNNLLEDGLCLPPRRKYMCTKYLEELDTEKVNTTNTLLKKVLVTAFYEGKQLKEQWDKIPMHSKKNKLCDIMKYSFADLGDIIRGKDKWNGTNGDNIIEKNLKTVFEKIYQENNVKQIYPNDASANYWKLREAWWYANRKEVWKAMTCSAPDEAEVHKKINNYGIENLTQILSKCGHKHDPPNYDYIPQRLRWMTEWGESFCEILYKKFHEMKTQCSECKQNINSCVSGQEMCIQCDNSCKDYKNLVEKWKSVFMIQKNKYSHLYEEANGNETNTKDELTKFLRNVNTECNETKTAEEYLDKSTKCSYYKFNNNDKLQIEYVFKDIPKIFEKACKCKESSPRSDDSSETRTPKEDSSPPIVSPTDVNEEQSIPINDILSSTIPLGVALALGSIAFLFLKKKTKSSVVNLFQILQIPKSDYDIPTKLSPNRYIPYTSGKYRGKRYIYLEGDSGTDSGYTDHYSDITSSESEYEELDINDIYVPGSPKYKTLIEVVLEPSGKNTTASGNNTTASGNNTTASDTQNDIQNDGIPSSKITDNEWNTLKDEFISNMLQNEPKDVPNDYSSGDIPMNTQPNTLYFDNNQEKPFITSIHDRNLYTGEENSYNINMSTNSMDDPKYVSNNVYS
ncbi:hypothetical protein PFMALIP_06277, partial [Plasmodium falciparum MaliPS096_E11]